MTHRLCLIAAFALLPSLVSAQSEERSGKPPAVSASIIPVGSNSDAIIVGTGPNARTIATDPGAAPPSTLTIRSRREFITIPTILNRPSPALPVRSGSLRLFEGQQIGENGDPPVFADFKIPETPGHYDIFINRAPNQKNWENAQSLILPASTTTFPAGSFRLINLSPLPVKWQIGKTVIDLAPRRARTIPIPSDQTGKLIPVRAAHAAGKSFQIILQTGIRLAADQRANLIVYPGRKPAKPCEVTWYYQSKPNTNLLKEERTTTP